MVVKSDMLYFKTNISKPLAYFKSGQFISEKNWHHKSFILENNYEIIIGIKGTLYIQQNDEKYEVNPGDVLFLLPGMLHFGYAPSEEGSSFYWLHFLCTSEEKILTESEISDSVSSMLNTNNLQEDILLPTFFSLIDTGKSFMYLKQILHIANSPYYTHLSTDYLVSELTIELTQQFINSFRSPVTNGSAVNKKFFQILEWVRVNATKEISVKMIADKFNFTADHLTRLLKKNIGMSTLKYINNIKINKAKELLLNSDKNIKEISYMICFKDEKYFMKLFKKYEGVTPSQYRDAYPKTYINTDSSDPEIPLPNYLSYKKYIDE